MSCTNLTDRQKEMLYGVLRRHFDTIRYGGEEWVEICEKVFETFGIDGIEEMKEDLELNKVFGL